MLITITNDRWFICIPKANIRLLDFLLSLFRGLSIVWIIWAFYPNRNLKLIKSTSLWLIYRPWALVVRHIEIVFFAVDLFWIIYRPETFIIEVAFIVCSSYRLRTIEFIHWLFFVNLFVSIAFDQIMSICERDNPTDCWVIPGWHLNLILSFWFNNLIIIDPWALVLFFEFWCLRSCRW